MRGQALRGQRKKLRCNYLQRALKEARRDEKRSLLSVGLACEQPYEG